MQDFKNKYNIIKLKKGKLYLLLYIIIKINGKMLASGPVTPGSQARSNDFTAQMTQRNNAKRS